MPNDYNGAGGVRDNKFAMRNDVTGLGCTEPRLEETRAIG